VLITFIYNIGWTFSFYLSQYISTKFAPASPPYPVVFDDNGTNYVYVFAGFFALITSLILNCRKGKSSPLGTRHSAYIGMIGTGFIFAAFPFTGILWPSQAAANPYRRFESPINIYFALTASVICTYISAAIFGKLKIGVRQSLVGILSGGVMVSVVSGTIYNIGACIAVGAFSGFISGFWL
jgi:ammonia channel protein AmtB